ncbi:MAG: amidohydrolase [Nocardioidaceae bacterium]
MTRLLLRNGYVHTPADPHATAIAFEDGQVVWTGDDDASVHFADNADRVLDLQGRLVTPAFVDAHAHLAQTGLANQSLDLGTAPSRTAALDALASYAARTDFPVVLGFGWDETHWPEQRRFTRTEVDRAVGDRPAFLARVDVHSAVASSAFLRAFPELRDLDGYGADGCLAREAHHHAREAVFRLIPEWAREEALLSALTQAATQGIGMVHELGAPHISPAEDFALLRKLRKAQTLPEVVGYWGELGGVERAQELGCAGAAGDLCADGAIGSRTAAMRAPYADDPTCGHLYLDAEQVRDHVVACTRADLQAGFHCIGDRATEAVVAGFRMAADIVGAPALVRGRHRLEHLEMVSAEDMRTLGELGVTASMQPMFDATWGGEDSLYAQRLGADRSRPMNAFASLNKAGVALAFGSDTPVTSFGPWSAVRAAAWHRTESERITVRAAFNAHTRGGWRAAGRDEGGVFALGAPASVAVWDVPGALRVQTPDARVAAWSTDPRAGVPQLPDLHPDIPLPSCVLTLVDGEVAFEEPGALT